VSGDVSPCNGGPEAGNASCVDGHRGPRCEVCVEPQYYFDVWSATCLPCGSVAVSLAKIAALVLFLALLVGVTSWIISSNWVPKRRLARDVVHFVRKYALLWRQSGMTGKMKIIIAMVQCIWAVPYVYDMDIPEQFDSLLSLFGWITALSPDIFLPGACYGSYLVRLTVSSTWPIVVLALIALKNIVQEGAARRKVAGTTSLREESANEGVTGAVGAPSPPPSPPPLPPPLLPPPPPPPPPLPPPSEATQSVEPLPPPPPPPPMSEAASPRVATMLITTPRAMLQRVSSLVSPRGRIAFLDAVGLSRLPPQPGDGPGRGSSVSVTSSDAEALEASESFGQRIRRQARQLSFRTAGRSGSARAALEVRRVQSSADGAAGVVGRGLLRALPLTLFLTFVVVPSTSERILSSFNCVEFSTADEPYELRAYLADDLTLDCASAEYAEVELWACVFLVIWPVGVPLFYVLLLLAAKRAIRDTRSTALTRASSFLWAEYEQRTFWWEPLDLLRRLTITGFVLIGTQGSPQLRVLIALLVTILFITMQFLLSPFKRPLDDRMMMLGHVCLLVILIAALVINVCNLSADTCETFGMGRTSYLPALVFVVFGTAMLVSAFLLLAWAAGRYATTLPTLRLVENGLEPPLTIAQGDKWHLFVSHVWSTGQDQAANIKRALQVILPGSRIFLDVDDLADISALESEIGQSALVLMFLSKGYFSSRNCLREIRCAVQLRKPIVLVHEANEAKGGLTLEESMSECPDELRDRVFDSRRRLGMAGGRAIQWHRIADFQKMSLKLIAEQLLLASPQYASTCDALPLYFPGEISADALSFELPVCLRFSRHNSGAGTVAKELASRFRELSVALLAEPSDASPCESGCSSESDAATAGTALTDSAALVREVFLLYLRRGTFAGEEGHELAADLRAVRAAGMRLLAVHENDPAQGGVAFSHFLTTTPEDLVEGGLYSSLAVAFHATPFREISIALAAKALGASKRMGARHAAAGRLNAAAAKTAAVLASSIHLSSRHGSARSGASGHRSSVRRTSDVTSDGEEAQDTVGSLPGLRVAPAGRSQQLPLGWAGGAAGSLRCLSGGLASSPPAVPVSRVSTGCRAGAEVTLVGGARRLEGGVGAVEEV